MRTTAAVAHPFQRIQPVENFENRLVGQPNGLAVHADAIMVRHEHRVCEALLGFSFRARREPL